MQKAGDYLKSINNLGIVPGLDAISKLLYELGSPQDYLKYIHIAGTNGKGSTSSFLTSILNKAGIKSGRFNSPSVFSVLEDISINGEYISEEEFIELENIAKEANEKVLDKYGLKPTAFETETAMALYYFNKQRVDIVVLECGMGGLLDATNVITSNICSIITGVSLEHTAYLGNTIADIAKMKAGIIKSNSAVFMPNSLDEEAKKVIKEIATEKNCYTFYVKPYDNVHFDAVYQYSNAGLAVDVSFYLKTAGFRIGIKHIEDGIKEFSLPGRYERLQENPDIIIDGAHNPEAVSKLVESLKLNYPDRKLRMVFGAFKDKDIRAMLKLVAPICSELVAVRVPTDRAMDEMNICRMAEEENINAIAITKPSQAVDYFLSKDDKSPLICFGSLSYLKEIKERVVKND